VIAEMAEQELADIEARVDAVPGFAWHTDEDRKAVFDTFGALIADCQDPAVADLLIHARGDLRRLIQEVRRLRAELQRCAAALPNEAAPASTAAGGTHGGEAQRGSV
jgi:hypothetical protein